MGSFSSGFNLGLLNSRTGGGGRSDKRALSDEEHATELGDKNREIEALQSQMSQVGPNHESYAGLQNRLNQVVQDRTMLFHPSTPGGLHRLGELIFHHHVLKDAAGAKTAPTAMGSVQTPGAMGAPGSTVNLPDGPAVSSTVPQTAADARARASQELGWAATPQQNPHQVYRDQLKQALPNLSNEDLDKAVEIHAGIAPKPTAEKPVTFKPLGKGYQSDGTGYQAMYGNDGSVVQREVPTDSVQQAPAHMTTEQLHRADYAKAIGKRPEDLTFEDTENMMRLLKQAGTGTTTATHTTFQNINGAITPVTVSTSSSKNYGGRPIPAQAPGTPATPTLHRRAGADPSLAESAVSANPAPTPAQVRSQAPRAQRPNTAGPTHTTGAPHSTPPAPGHGAGNVRVGQPIGYKDTPAATKAFQARDQAQAAYLDVKNAFDHPSSLSDKGVVLAWLRGRVNRVTASEIQAVNSLGGAELAFDNGVARVMRGEMSPRQRKWFLDSAKANLDIQTQVASKYPNAGNAPATGGNGVSDDDFLMNVGRAK